MKKKIVLTFILVFIFAASSFAAEKKACIPNSELQALKLRHLYTKLHLANEKCSFASYASFEKESLSHMKRNADILKHLFIRTGGGQNHFDVFVTDVAKSSSVEFLYNNDFCGVSEKLMIDLTELFKQSDYAIINKFVEENSNLKLTNYNLCGY